MSFFNSNFFNTLFQQQPSECQQQPSECQQQPHIFSPSTTDTLPNGSPSPTSIWECMGIFPDGCEYKFCSKTFEYQNRYIGTGHSVMGAVVCSERCDNSLLKYPW